MQHRGLMILLLTIASLITNSGQAADSEQGAQRIAVIGATARSGRIIIRQALEAGYTVTGLARSPQKLGFTHPRLTLVKGDVRDAASLEAALKGDEVVICMVGKNTPSDPTQPIGPVDLYTVMGENLIAAMKTQGNRRLIMASSTGVEHRVDREATAPASDAMPDQWRFNARFLYNDMADMEAMIEDSGLDYILLRPGFMVEEPARNDLQFTTAGDTPKQRTITYEDFAAFTLEQIHSDEFLNQAVGIYSAQIMDPAAEIRKFQEKLRQQQKQ